MKKNDENWPVAVEYDETRNENSFKGGYSSNPTLFPILLLVSKMRPVLFSINQQASQSSSDLPLSAGEEVHDGSGSAATSTSAQRLVPKRSVLRCNDLSLFPPLFECCGIIPYPTLPTLTLPNLPYPYHTIILRVLILC